MENKVTTGEDLREETGNAADLSADSAPDKDDAGMADTAGAEDTTAAADTAAEADAAADTAADTAPGPDDSGTEPEPAREAVERIPDMPRIEREGLTEAEAADRLEKGLVNTPVEHSDKTLGSIIRSNLLTYFNLIFLIIAVCLCVVGSFRDLTFLPVIIANILIGIIQEWRAKRLMDKVRILTDPKARVVRAGKEREILSSEIVQDDLMILEAGRQIPADARLVDGSVTVNESLLTGEADEISKKHGDELLSGSFVVAGSCRAIVTRVGEASYGNALTIEAKRSERGEQSEMIRSLDRLVKIVGIAIIPIAAVLFYQQHIISGLSLKASVTGTVAAILGMIPEGLYLLASVAMVVSVMRLAMNRVLVHNMKSIETLARADVLCVDKTGTITENVMSVWRAVPMRRSAQSGAGIDEVYQSDYSAGDDGMYPVRYDDTAEDLAILELRLGDFVACHSSDNSTMKAMQAYFTRKSGKRPDRVIPFSPVYKYSAAQFGGSAYVLGAPEFVLGSQYPVYRDQIEVYSLRGYRVLIFGVFQGELTGEALKQPVTPMGMVLLSNPVRKNAPETFRYFTEQHVKVKVISGDHPLTVSEVAMQAQIPDADRFVDASMLTDEELEAAAGEYTVFGRVSPQQKRILVRALKKQGHTVAMTGDGINDVLALKDADCSIAMASGADAAAHAAKMVLLDSDFARMPSVVTEGRRVVNNIQRTASLFLVKNIFSVLLSIFSIFFMLNYPLAPSQVSLISMFTIGIPAFFLSLETNREPIRGHFLSNVFLRALPAGLTDFAVISALVLFCREFKVAGDDLSTSCTILLGIVGIMILYKIMQPMTKFHWFLWLAMIAGIICCMTILHYLFHITSISGRCTMLLVIFAIVTEPVLRYLSLAVEKIRQLCSYIMGKIRHQRDEEEKLFAELR